MTRRKHCRLTVRRHSRSHADGPGGRTSPTPPRRVDAGCRPTGRRRRRSTPRTRAASRTSSRSASAGCSPRRSRSCADRRRSWPPTSRRRRRIGSKAQLCGDAHLANFGVFASPERRLVFDVNDFDETYRGPWEWDLKRLAASVVVAARENGFPERRTATWRASSRGGTAGGCGDSPHASAPGLVRRDPDRVDHRACRARSRGQGGRTAIEISIEEAQRKDHMAAFGKLSIDRARRRLAHPRSAAAPPALADDDPGRWIAPYLSGCLRPSLAGPPVAGREASADRRRAQGRRGRQRRDALLRRAVRRPGRRSAHPPGQGGRRVGPGPVYPRAPLAPPGRAGRDRSADHAGRLGQLPRLDESPASGTEYYVRQLHDMKYGVDIAGLRAPGMRLYAEVCAWALARADLAHRLEGFRRDRSRRASDMRRLAEGWARMARTAGPRKAPRTEATTARLLALAFPERLAKARGAPGQFLLANGRGANSTRPIRCLDRLISSWRSYPARPPPPASCSPLLPMKLT